MPLWVRGAFERFGILVQDENAVRWPLHPHRLRYLNDALKAVAIHKPTAATRTRILSLKAGSRQELPDSASSLVQVMRNVLNADNEEVIGFNAVTTVSRLDMDAHVPAWHDSSVWPVQKRVVHIVYDENNPRVFYVWPPNNGSGRVEAMVTMLPDEIATPASPNMIESYDMFADLDGIYMNAVVSFMAHRAYLMDDQFPDNAARAQQHLQLFANDLGVKLQNEFALSPNRPAPRPETMDG